MTTILNGCLNIYLKMCYLINCGQLHILYVFNVKQYFSSVLRHEISFPKIIQNNGRKTLYFRPRLRGIVFTFSIISWRLNHLRLFSWIYFIIITFSIKYRVQFKSHGSLHISFSFIRIIRINIVDIILLTLISGGE